MQRRLVHVHDFVFTHWVGRNRYACACGSKAYEDGDGLVIYTGVDKGARLARRRIDVKR